MSWPSDMRDVGRSKEAGFTLFEMVVVLAVLGLLTALIASNGARVSPAVHARAAAQEISGALRSARTEAMMSNRSVALVLDLAARSYRWADEPQQALPRDVNISLLTSRDLLTQSGGTGLIRFDPDGGSSGGRITIEGSGAVWWVGVDWLSGRVTVEEQGRQSE
jgi:general secretion pathway protein H